MDANMNAHEKAEEKYYWEQAYAEYERDAFAQMDAEFEAFLEGGRALYIPTHGWIVVYEEGA